MDIKKYIESGILEEYVLMHQSNFEVEKMAAKYPEIKQEIEKIERALELYALLHSVSPPPGLLENILKRADQLLKNKEEEK